MYTERHSKYPKVSAAMRDSKKSVKFMQVLDRSIFLRLKDVARNRGVTVQELIRVLVIPEWMHQFEDESKREETLRRHKRARTAGTRATPMLKVRSGAGRA
jgi:hypothetical protein